LQNGSIYVSGNAELFIRRANLTLLSDGNFEHEVKATDYSVVHIELSFVASNRQLDMSFLYHSKGIITNSTLTHEVVCSDNSDVMIINSTMGSTMGGLSLGYHSQVQIEDSCLYGFTHLIFADGSSARIDGLRPGFCTYWNLQKNQTATNILSNVTIVDTYVYSWALCFDSLAQGIVMNSVIDKILLTLKDTVIHLDGIKPQLYESLQIGSVNLVNTTVANHWALLLDDKDEVTISHSVMYVGSGGANLHFSIEDSLVSFYFDSYHGILTCNNASITVAGKGVFDSDFYISGNLSVTPPWWEGKWWDSSSITRNYNILAKDTSGNPMENARLTLFNQNHTSIWNGTTDSLGQADFNLTFADGNYTDDLGLEVVKGNYSASMNVIFLSDTPIILTMHYFADLNADGRVNIQDITIVAVAYNSRLGDPNWNKIADLDKDGIVNIIDITMVAKDYGKTV
jgi:hypothetical protein